MIYSLCLLLLLLLLLAAVVVRLRMSDLILNSGESGREASVPCPQWVFSDELGVHGGDLCVIYDLGPHVRWRPA